MSDQLNFKQVPFDTMYYNNLSKQAGQVLIECDPNRTVLKIIESCITKNNTVLTDAELAQWIFRYHVQRTKNHVENVKLCANYLRDFFKFGEYFARFIAKVQHHDYDKLQGNEHVASFALNAPLYKYKDLYEISPESKRVYEEIEWVKHHMLNDHHPENYMHRPDPEKNQWVISDEELENTYKDKGGHPAILMALGEMVADWAAVSIEMGDTAKDWWLRNKDKRWSYGPKYTQALEACLEWIPSKLYVQSSEPIPEPPKLKMNVTSNISEERISQAVVNNIKDGLVYHASPIKLAFLAGKHTGNWSGEQGNVFVTPVKGLAACFVINKNDVVDKAEQQLGGRLIGLNFGYDVWNKPVDKLRTLPREIVVTLNVRGLKPFTGESTGYLYTIDYIKYADKTHMFRKNPNSDVEFLIEGDVHYKSCEKITIKWKGVSSEDDIKRHGEAKVDSETSLEKYDEQKLRDSVYSEETAHLVIRKESDINSISDLKAFFSHCKYGLVDISAGKLWSETHNNTTEQDYDDNWKLLSANELIKYKCGICYDTVLLTKTVFDRLNIKYKLFFAYCNKGDGPTHTFIIYQDSDRWRWLEGSWGSFKRNSFVSPNSNTLVSWIGKALANNAGIQQQILELNNYPKPGVTMKEFQHAVLRGSKWGLVNVDRTSQTSLETYDPPYTEQQMRDHGYSEDVIARLKNDTKESSISTEVMELLNDTVEEKRLTALAKPLYAPTGKNSWEHIQQDVGNAVTMIQAIKHRRLTLQEYATILFHDCAVKSRKSKNKHGLYSAELAKSILLKTEYFTEEAVEAICTAIVEHDFDTNPKSIYTSELSDLLASADFNPPNVAWILNKSYAWGLSKGFSHDECISNSLKTIPEKYGSHGTVVIPKLYGEFYKNQIPVMQRTFDKLTREECERIIMDYRRRHGLKEGDLSLPDPSLESISSDVKFKGCASSEFVSEEAQQSSTPSKIAQKKKKILDFICKLCDTMEPSGLNSKRYRRIIGQMNDKEFDQFMNYMKEGKWQLHLVAPNMIVNLQNEDLLKACDLIGLDLFQRVWMYDRATGRKYLTDNKYMFVKLPIRRQQQFLDEKISVPDNDRTIDGLTGQVTGDSRACSITNPEIQILAARGLDKTMQELVNVRGGNIHGYSEFRRMLEENGEADLDMIDPNSRTRASVVGGKLLQSMMLDTNL